MDSPPHPSSLDESGHAEKEAPPSPGLVEDASTVVIAVPSEQLPEWKIGRQEVLIMIALMVVSLVAALDTTVLITALPVSKLKHQLIPRCFA